MSPEHKQMTRLLTRLSITIALLVGITMPTSYFLIAYYNLSGSLEFKAKVKAHGQTELVTTMPNTWMYAENRIQGLLQHEPVVLENEQVAIYDASGRLITSAGDEVKTPYISRSFYLYDIGNIVGKVVVSASISNILINTAVLAVLAVLAGAIILTVMRLIPIRQLNKLSAQLLDEKERALITLDSINDAVLRTDVNGHVRFINSAGKKMLGQSLDDIKGLPVTDVIHITDNSTGEPIVQAITQALKTQMEISCNSQSMLNVSENIQIAVEERAAPIFSNKGELLGAVLSLRDVSIARDYLERRSWEASHDSLTEIWNRRAFENNINTAVRQANKNGVPAVLCFMDIDRFKVVNDSCGHAAGDELLKNLTQLMLLTIRRFDILARLGGDEFGLLLEGCDVTQAKMVANDLIEAVENFQFTCGNQIFTVGISIGMTQIEANSHLDYNDLMSEADSACYWAKEHGRNQVCLFSANDIDLAVKRDQSSWVARISSALKENRFVLYHQIYRTLNKEMGTRLHLEVLLRMIDEDGSIIAPNLFLRAAERYDLVQEIDRWVINKVFSGFHRLLEKHQDTDIMVNINLSGASINSENLFTYIEHKIIQFDIDPSSICFEVTETVAVTNLNSAIEFINACKGIGIKFALDDFGTGTSSLGHLKNLPVDYLKIDGSFVLNLETNAVDKEMVQSINRIAHLLGKVTVAEFAENEAIIEILAEFGVDFAQGYGVCRPIPLWPS